ncbi:bifunctional [glutamate--ammonia ligase]-adenylyl-L-tyrosine phosphorylase/[glutamate--ammonia-ligase] adenylyltransferase [Cobetia amphilecti]|uniref:Bifunctional glutamine synthetase adenylyltransferase/adenylyl-removing enzyme n=2 Tax=Gammaproteobacteria TaxID=1236 RepID=A0AAP4U1J7_9GAMM|nr:bifunctional [glutamate--ammonia ligase]-adenylyl-L-tyrosine phosphorylase/[glutamate--ammonia-ligase] adenylyltransferase [Cobetia amphilecti]MDO6673231.1 bifunctional [glutamate--ammonia ligase]-adenylyl-L-tyrosine phosphorylase/[glutamate--ammonia-ligase] adenylyltransferase [Cobetia amphilecti]
MPQPSPAQSRPLLPADFLAPSSLLAEQSADSRATLESALCAAQERLEESLTQAENLSEMRGDDSSPLATFLALDERQRSQLGRLITLSDFALETLCRRPELLSELLESGELERALPVAQLTERLAAGLISADDEKAMQQVLRRFRQLRMLGIVWRDLNGADMWQTAAAVSHLAEVTLEGALGWLEASLEPRYGRPAPDRFGEPQRLVVLGMGKLGAGELNLSSDIDLIFAFPDKGETSGGRKSLDHQEYFTRLGQKLIAALDAMTADGFVFRVDMRLRPLGDGGPLVGSFSMLASYYQDQGREWERYAMLKARPVAGSVAAGERLIAHLRPFVYRKYLDFGAIESLREMKAMINREVKRRGLSDNIKLGSGGIREVEFVAQAFQLIRGGRESELQVTSLKQAFARLPALGLLPQAVVDELVPDYVFLRDLEHALQAQADRQTQTLPLDPLGRERLALAMKLPDWEALTARLEEVRTRIRHHFDNVIAAPEDDEAEQGEGQQALDEWRALWRGELTAEEGEALLAESGFESAAESFRRLDSLRRSRAVQGMQRIGFDRLDALMPPLLQALGSAAGDPEKPGEHDASRVLERVLPLIEAVLRRTAYLALLRENPDALAQLMRLCAASPWIAEQLARYPVLLDELLHPHNLYSPADKTRLADELRTALSRIPEDDEEALLEALRVFRHAQVLHVAASDIAGARPLMKVSDYLTFIAEVVLEQVLAMAWKTLTRKHGFPIGRDGQPITGDSLSGSFVIVGYGKLGGIELGYGSDLDLVFLHDAASKGQTDGPRPLDNPLFFTRLGQRIIHLLTAVTPAGALYEVDMRLRPSGNSGLLVSSLAAFRDYQLTQAWTWEHQALVRARAVAGDPALALAFEEVRREVLGQQRDEKTLRQEVIAMRHKMRDHLGSSAKDREAGQFHLKQDAGGIVDIEFLAQYCVLALSYQVPALLEWSDNMRLLETLESCGRLPGEQAGELREAYLAYRDVSHRLALEKHGSLMRLEQHPVIAAHRERVITLWQALLGEDQVSHEGV